MITHLISIRVDKDEQYHYFTNNYNKLKEEPVYGVIFGYMNTGIYLNRDIFKNQNFKFDISKISENEIVDISFTDYMLFYYLFDRNNKNEKDKKYNLFNTLNKILEEKRWDDISKKL